MVNERRLSVSDRLFRRDPETRARLGSENVLQFHEPVVNGADGFVAYSHNLLFDYAVARLWVRDLPPEVTEKFAEKAGHQLLLAIRPSLQIAFQRLWNAGNAAFWEAAFRWFETKPVVTCLMACL